MIDYTMACSSFFTLCSFMSLSVFCVYVVTPKPTPHRLLHIHQIDINIHEEAGGRCLEMGG